MKIVIIGNSAAAIGCVEGFRQYDQESEITIVSKEPYPVYGRPLISYLLCGKTTEEKMKQYRSPDFYEKNGVKTLLGQTAVKIDPEKKTVQLADGSSLPYDKLLVAAGSRPFVPPMEGMDSVEKKFSFMTLDDALSLKAALTPETRVLIVGAGLIGLKCAEGIEKLVQSIDVVDLAARILPSVLDEEASAIVQKHIEGCGVRFHLGTSVARFEPNCAHLANGEDIGFDVLVVAVGVRANVELVKEAGGQTGRGISIDRVCKTSLPDVYAAGDCVECYDSAAEVTRVLAVLPNAYLQGECAGKAMAGVEEPFDKYIPLNSGGFFGLHLCTAGSYEGESYLEESAENETYKRIVSKDGLMKGFILIGDVARSGIYTAMIRNRTRLDTVDYQLLCQKPQLMAFAKKDREKMLGGAK